MSTQDSKGGGTDLHAGGRAVWASQALTHAWLVCTGFLVESKQHEEEVTEEVQDTDHQVWSRSKAAGAPPKKEDVSPAKEDKESEFWKMLQEPEEQAAGREEAQAGVRSGLSAVPDEPGLRPWDG